MIIISTDLRNKRVNDKLAQYLKACRNVYPEQQRKREQEVTACNHLFVLYQPSIYHHANHSSDCYTDEAIIECVHCGLTNKFIDFERQLRLSGEIVHVSENLKKLGFYDYLKYFPSIRIYPFENKLFEKFIKEKELSEIKILGIEKPTFYQLGLEKYAIKCEHLGLLYKIAMQVNPNNTEEETLEVMRSLFSLETLSEKLKLENIEDASALISRYQDSIKLSRKKEA